MQMEIPPSPSTPSKKDEEMRREGRQHGLVRTHIVLPAPLNPRPKSRVLNQLDAPPTAGVYAKAPSKPTNHSKFTGRCGKPMCASCHGRPAWKSKGKAKGSSKLRRTFEDGQLSTHRGVLSVTGAAGRLLDEIDEDVESTVSALDLDGGLDDVEDEVLTQGREIVVVDGEGSLLNNTGWAPGDEEDGDWFLVGRI